MAPGAEGTGAFGLFFNAQNIRHGFPFGILNITKKQTGGRWKWRHGKSTRVYGLERASPRSKRKRRRCVSQWKKSDKNAHSLAIFSCFIVFGFYGEGRIRETVGGSEPEEKAATAEGKD